MQGQRAKGGWGFGLAHDLHCGLPRRVTDAAAAVPRATGGSYTDEASGIPNVRLSAPLGVAGFIAAGTQVLVATPLTSMALHQASAGGALTIAAFESAANEIGTAFGLPGLKLPQAIPVVTGQTNAYGRALIDVSGLLGSGVTLENLISGKRVVVPQGNSDILNSSLCQGASSAAQVQVAQVSTAGGIYLVEDGSPADAGLKFVVSEPDSSWRALLPASGAVMGCDVTVNTVQSVSLSCPSAALLPKLTLIGEGGAESVPSKLPSSGVLIAGRRIDGTGSRLPSGLDVNLSSTLARIGDAALPAAIPATGGVTITAGSAGLISTGTTISSGPAILLTGATGTIGTIGGVVLGSLGTSGTNGLACKVQVTPAAGSVVVSPGTVLVTN